MLLFERNVVLEASFFAFCAHLVQLQTVTWSEHDRSGTQGQHSCVDLDCHKLQHSIEVLSHQQRNLPIVQWKIEKATLSTQYQFITTSAFSVSVFAADNALLNSAIPCVNFLFAAFASSSTTVNLSRTTRSFEWKADDCHKAQDLLMQVFKERIKFA